MKMQNNPNVRQMMQKDPTLYNRACQARINPNFMSLLQTDPGMANLIMELMGLGEMVKQQQEKQKQG